jgi:hypothetical protein
MHTLMPNTDPASQYTLLHKLGTGSFGTVYKGSVSPCVGGSKAQYMIVRMHNETQQIVAIKQIGQSALLVRLGCGSDERDAIPNRSRGFRR